MSGIILLLLLLYALKMLKSSISVLVLLALGLRQGLAHPPRKANTFTVLDPTTNRLLECDSCPPGTHLHSKCTATQRTRCSACPRGSYTELWNSISGCLRCRACDWNQEQETECRSDRDRRCRCQTGYYLEDEDCLPHRKCPSGEGVLHTGTPDADTECHTCLNGTFSDQNSAVQACLEYQRCGSAGMQRLLPGTRWHDNICVSCSDNRSEAVDHLRGILPVFFTHHRIPHRILRLIFNQLQSMSGQTPPTTERSYSNIQDRINTWVSSARPARLEELPGVISKAGAKHTAQRLRMKLKQIKENMKNICV